MTKSSMLVSLTLSLSLCCAGDVTAQCGYVPPTSVPLCSGTDLVFQVALPFAFPFHGQAYTAITISTNGFVWLGPATNARCCTVGSGQFLQDPPSIAILWTALVASNGVYFEVDYSSMRATVTWPGVHEAGHQDVFDLQMTLAASGQVDFWYGPGAVITSHTAISGITEGSGAMAGPIGFATDLPHSSVQSTVYQQFAAGQMNLAGQGIQFVPSSATSWVVLDAGCAPWP